MTECERFVKDGLFTPDFFRPEVRCDFLVDENRKKIWAIELDLLIKFDAVCKKHNLKYFLMYGSLLGAVRHKGFIPWDDVLDVAMPKEDYEKFLTLANEFDHPYFLQTPYTDNGYFFSFAKLINDNTSAISKMFAFQNFHKGNLQKEFAVEIKKVEKLYEYIKKDAERLGYKKVLCHNDVYDPNYLIDSNNEIYLIDWEYAGINYEANDICCILCRYDWNDEKIEKYLLSYFGRDLNPDEKRFYYAFIPVCAFYWFAWGLYKGSVGDDDGFFFMPSYHNLVRFIDSALSSYEE